MSGPSLSGTPSVTQAGLIIIIAALRSIYFSQSSEKLIEDKKKEMKAERKAVVNCKLLY